MRFIGKDPNIIDAYYTATAEGAITAGKPVIVEADGDVAQVAIGAASAGTAVEVGTYRVGSYHAVTFDPDNSKVIYAYDKTDSLNKGHAIVGTISGSSISFGTDVQFEAGATTWIAATYDTANDKVVIAFTDAGNSNYGKAIVGTVSGTSISFGSAVTFNAGNTNNIQATYDSTNGKVVIAYRDSANNNYGTAIVGTVSGTSISFGTETVFASINSTSYHSSAFDSNAGKVVVTYRDNTSGFQGKAVVGTVSGTSISFGSAVTFESDRADNITCSFDSSNNKIVCVYMDYNAGGVANTRKPTAVVGTVSGTSISFGSSVLIEDVKCVKPTSAFDSGSGKVIVMYGDVDNDELVHITSGSVSGTSMSFVTPIEISGTDIFISDVPTIAGDPASTKSACFFRDDNNTDRGTAVIYDAGSPNLTTENYIGIAADTYADNEDSTIGIVGCIDRNQTGLTAGQQYYVQTDGTLSTTAGDPSVLAGTAISATELVVKE
jgi:hypothetical protein